MHHKVPDSSHTLPYMVVGALKVKDREMEPAGCGEELIGETNKSLEKFVLELTKLQRQIPLLDFPVELIDSLLDGIRADNLKQNGRRPLHYPGDPVPVSATPTSLVDLNRIAVLLAEGLVAKYGRDAIVRKFGEQLQLSLPVQPEAEGEGGAGDLGEEGGEVVGVEPILLVAADEIGSPGLNESEGVACHGNALSEVDDESAVYGERGRGRFGEARRIAYTQIHAGMAFAKV